MQISSELRNDIKAYRKTKSLSQAELGIKLGVAQSTVMRWEKPNSRVIRPSHWLKLEQLIYTKTPPPAAILPRSDCEKICEGFDAWDTAMVKTYRTLDKRGKDEVQKVCKQQAERFHGTAKAS